MIVTISNYESFSESGGVLTVIGCEEPAELNPDPTFLLGYEGWEPQCNEGLIELDSAAFNFTDCGGGDRLVATGDTKNTLLANLADFTAYMVRVTVTDYVSGEPSCTLKGGTNVALTGVGGGVFEGTVTTGDTLDPVRLRGNSTNDFTAKVTQLSIQAA